MSKDIFIEPSNINFSNTKALFTTRALSGTDDLTKIFNISEKSIYFPVQKHTSKIHVLKSDLKPVVADAVLTDRKGILIGVQVADCVPILLYDRKKSVIGAVHAGWRGTVRQILKDTIIMMSERFQSSADDIFIALGPSIRRCCYNVGEDVMTAIKNVTGSGRHYIKKDGKFFVDLTSANIIQALSVGVPPQNIWQSKECTFCNPHRFHSYRYSKNHVPEVSQTGRQVGVVRM